LKGKELPYEESSLKATDATKKTLREAWLRLKLKSDKNPNLEIDWDFL
jgi:hypothetical protein